MENSAIIQLSVAAAIRGARRAEGNGEAAAALAVAELAVRRHDFGRAIAFLAYAQRLSPSATEITLAIGEARLHLGDPRAVEALELVVRRTDWCDAWIRLAASRMLSDNAAQAAADLNETLSRNAPANNAGFRRMASAITQATGASGWCGLNTRGQLIIGGTGGLASDPDTLAIKLDGKPALFRLLAGRPGTGVQRLQVLGDWQNARRLTVQKGRLKLIGSPIDVQKLLRFEGFVRAEAGALRGWAWLPGEREMAPEITIVSRADPQRRLRVRAQDPETEPGSFPPLASPRAFRVPRADVEALGGYVDVLSPLGRQLYGSPINPLAEIISATAAAATIARRFPARGEAEPSDSAANEISIPADIVGVKPAHPAPTAVRCVTVVVPVYRGFKVTMDCIDSILAVQIEGEELLVVVDASPEPDLVTTLITRAGKGDFALDLRPVNKGFPATANVGLKHAAASGADVVLLNSDTLVPPGWLGDLRAAIYGSHDIGTATPSSNAATIFSYPDVERTNPIPDLVETLHLAGLAREANGGTVVDVPTGHGFCLYIRNECLNDTGLLREDLFAQGYAEENDFCLRARHLGWRHVAVPGVFIGHLEGQSFAGAKVHLTERNLRILNRLHPGYERMIIDWQARQPLAEARRKIDVLRWKCDQGSRPGVLLVTHDRGGGVLRHIRERALQHQADGSRALIMRPTKNRAGAGCRISSLDEESWPNLVYSIPEEIGELQAFLADCRIGAVEIHHFIGHADAVINLAAALDASYSLHVHDFSWYCPRITLTRTNHSYCGEPPIEDCADCVREHGNNIDEDLAPSALFKRSRRLLQKADRIIAPSADTARRISRRFGLPVQLGIWEDETSHLRLGPVLADSGRKRRICVAGAIGYEKGYSLLLECARIVANEKLPIEFVIVGFTRNDLPLLQTGVVNITGRYEEAEAVALIREQRADFAFLSALWPETWSYVLSQLWEAGLPVIAFDIGAPSERIKRRQGGLTIPLNMPARRLVQVFTSFVAEPTMAI